ncbi:MAG: hypothetical protein AAF560_34115, partial [Acidobacteriota bacterium]
MLVLVCAQGCGVDDSSCADLWQVERHAEAAETCEAAFERDGDTEAGLTAARAQLALGHDDAVLAWPARLAGSHQQAEALRLASDVWRRRDDVAAARSALEQALAVERARASDGDLAASREAWTLYLLAYLEWSQTRYRPALSYALESASAARRQGDADAERMAVEMQQGVLSAVGDLASARAVHRRRQALTPEPSGLEAAYLLAHEGDLWLDSDRLPLARQATLEALEHAAEVPELGNTFFRSIHLNLVEIALRRSELETARRHLQAALAHAAPEGVVPDGAAPDGAAPDGAAPDGATTDEALPTSLHYYRARLAAEEGRWDEAARDLNAALAAEPVADWTWRLQQQLGRVEQARGDTATAETAYRSAVAVVETMRRELALDTLKPWLMERKRQTFEALFGLLIDQRRFDEASAVAEQARAQTFLDAFVRGLEAPSGASEAAPGNAAPANAAPANATNQRVGEAALERLQVLETLLSVVADAPSREPRPVAELRQQLQGRALLSY